MKICVCKVANRARRTMVSQLFCFCFCRRWFNAFATLNSFLRSRADFVCVRVVNSGLPWLHMNHVSIIRLLFHCRANANACGFPFLLRCVWLVETLEQYYRYVLYLTTCILNELLIRPFHSVKMQEDTSSIVY